MTAISLAMMTIIAVVDWLRIRQNLENEFLREAFVTARGLEISLASGPELDLGDAAFAALQKAQLNNPELIFVQISVAQGAELVVRLASTPQMAGKAASALATDAFQTRQPGYMFSTFETDARHLTVAAPLVIAKAPRGTVELRFTLERLAADARAQFFWDMGILATFVVVLSVALYVAVRRFVLAPLWRVIGDIQRFTATQDLPPPNALPKDEFGALSRQFREMAQTLVQTNERQSQTSRLEAVGQLTGGVAHDFNNLMSVVSSSLQLLPNAKTTRERQDLIETAMRAVEHGTSLTSQMLALGRRSPLLPVPTDINSAAQQFKGFLRRVLPSHISLSVVEAQEAPVAIVDPAMLQNALLNLALNAKAAMPNGGDLEIRVELADGSRIKGPKPVAPGSYAVVSMRDSGVGIPPAMLDKVFEPFYTTRDVGQGSGLGLSMVRGFAEQSNGAIQIESTVGEGTRVSMFFPLSQETPARPAAPLRQTHLPPSGNQAATVLVVEDNPQLLALLALKLGRDDFDVIKAESGDAAIDIMNKGTRVDLVLSDMVMPGTNQGLDVLKHAKGLARPVPVILMSGYADIRASGAIDLQMADRFLEKPINLGHLSQEVAALVAACQSASQHG